MLILRRSGGTAMPCTEENTTFRDLADEVHRMLAEELLATGALSVEDVALRLGYAEATSFIAAFKRWTGTTPGAYRRARRSGHAESPGHAS